MSEGEAVLESRGELIGEGSLIEEVKSKAFEKQAMWQNFKPETKRDKEVVENINKNADNFWQYFKKISPQNYSLLDTPEKLIEALNQAEGNFVQEGGKFNLHGATHQVFEIHPPHVINNQEASERILDLCEKEGYSLMSGTNFWDNPPEVGRLFIPAIYLVKKVG